MEYSKDNNGLREPEITKTYNPAPLFIQEVNASKLMAFPTFLPTEPGVYSVILEVNDKANNSKYTRRIAIFDQESEISVSPTQRLFVKSASPDTNYAWQTHQYSKIEVSWENHFINEIHEKGHFLAKIVDYTPRLSEGTFGRRQYYKKILSGFDDNEGNRSKSAIPNINSIIRFETRSRMLNAQVSYGKWTVVTPLSENVTSTLSDVRDGDSHEIQVRAFDIMGNVRVDSTVVHFDRSEPDVFPAKLSYNVVDGKYPFTSR